MRQETKIKLADLIVGTSPDKMKAALQKNETIQMRVSLKDKYSMQWAAKSCGLTLTEYLTRLHYIAEGNLKQNPE